jgi:hypothetical protein
LLPELCVMPHTTKWYTKPTLICHWSALAFGNRGNKMKGCIISPAWKSLWSICCHRSFSRQQWPKRKETVNTLSHEKKIHHLQAQSSPLFFVCLILTHDPLPSQGCPVQFQTVSLQGLSFLSSRIIKKYYPKRHNFS